MNLNRIENHHFPKKTILIFVHHIKCPQILLFYDIICMHGLDGYVEKLIIKNEINI